MNIDKNSAELRSLGKTDIKITPIGQGVMQFMGGTRMGISCFQLCQNRNLMKS
jgi:hypothetical protein